MAAFCLHVLFPHVSHFLSAAGRTQREHTGPVCCLLSAVCQRRTQDLLCINVKATKRKTAHTSIWFIHLNTIEALREEGCRFGLGACGAMVMEEEEEETGL